MPSRKAASLLCAVPPATSVLQHGTVCVCVYAAVPAWQVRPLEDSFKFGSFFTPLLHESDFEAKPSVLLLGQYSTGQCLTCACLPAFGRPSVPLSVSEPDSRTCA